MIGRLGVLWLATAILASVALASDWTTYVNDRFGATAEIPGSYKAGDPPANNDGLSFTSPDGDATIVVWGALAKVMDENFADYAKRLVGYDTDDGWTVSYSAGKKDWYAFSGSKADRIFFEKVIQTCKGDIANHVRLEYPAARKSEFDPIVTHVTKSLRSGKAWQC
jgi:serine/threonine-protein kinase